MKLALLGAAGLLLSGIAWLLGGAEGLFGGLVATGSQVGAVTLLKPRMRAPTAVFVGAWAAGMALRLAGLAAVLVLVSPLKGGLGYLGVLLPLLFAETRFLK